MDIDSGQAQRFGDHPNAFGFLRLMFACLVIVAHTPEIYDGSRAREPLMNVSGSISFGDVAVSGFFLISGYLICSSYVLSRSDYRYSIKRIVRIYPGFIFAYAICIFIVAPLGCANTPTIDNFFKYVEGALLLQEPDIRDAFKGTSYPTVNGAMWTICYEFKCYIGLMILGRLGFLQERWPIIALTLLFIVLSLFLPIEYKPYEFSIERYPEPSLVSYAGLKALVIADKHQSVRLYGLFLSGVCFYLYRHSIKLSVNIAVFSFLMYIVFIFSRFTVNIGTSIFGAYALFAVASANGRNWISNINSRNDVSYGIYLYAWPTTKLILWSFPKIELIPLEMTTLIASYIMGLASWKFIERPSMLLVRRKLMPSAGRET